MTTKIVLSELPQDYYRPVFGPVYYNKVSKADKQWRVYMWAEGEAVEELVNERWTIYSPEESLKFIQDNGLEEEFPIISNAHWRDGVLTVWWIQGEKTVVMKERIWAEDLVGRLMKAAGAESVWLHSSAEFYAYYMMDDGHRWDAIREVITE